MMAAGLNKITISGVKSAKNKNQQIGGEKISHHWKRQNQTQQRIQTAHSFDQKQEAQTASAPGDNGVCGGAQEYSAIDTLQIT
jgi:hypothetical protein